MKKTLLLFPLFFFALALTLHADDKKDKKKENSGIYIKGFGWGCFGDFGSVAKYAAYNYDEYSSNNDTTFLQVKKPFPISFLYFGFNNHFLIKKMGREKSISINFYPSIGLNAIRNRFMSLTLPLMVCFNTGNVSTFESKKDIGFTVGAGVEYINAGLIKITEDESLWDIDFKTSRGFEGAKRSFIQPCVNLGLRYFTKSDHAQELNIKYGMHNADVYDMYKKMPLTEKRRASNFWFRLSFVHYIGY